MSAGKRAIEKYKKLPVQARALFWFLICSFLQKGISVITTPIFTRLMTPGEYGQFATFNSWFTILTIVISLSLYQGVHLQGLVKFDTEGKVFSSSMQGLTTVLIFAWTVIYAIFHDFWNGLLHLTTVQMLSMLAMIWTMAVFNFWANEQRVKYSYKLLVIVTLLVSLIKPIVEIILILNTNDKVTARILGIVIVELIGFSWMYIYQMREGKQFFSKKYWKYALAYNIPLVPHYLSQVVLNSSDRIMIEDMVGSDAAGIYNLAYSLALIMTLFNSALVQTLNPWMYQKIKEKRDTEMAGVAYISLGIIAVLNLIIIGFAPEAVAIFAPKTYYDAIWVVPPVAMSVFFMFSYDLYAKHAFYYEKTKVLMVISVVAASLNVLLNLIFIKQYGYIAAGYTTLICFMIYSIAHYMYMRKLCRKYCDGVYPYKTKILVLITAVFMIAGFALLATYINIYVRYICMAIVLCILFVCRKRIAKIIKQIVELRHIK